MPQGRLHRIVFPCILLLSLRPNLPAQAQQPSSTLHSAGRDRTVTLNVVIDAKDPNQPAPLLQQSDFVLLDNGHAVPLAEFRHVTEGRQPVRVVIVVDQLNIWTAGLSNQLHQTVQFLRTYPGRLPFPTTLAILTERGLQIDRGFVTDAAALSAQLQSIGIKLRPLSQSSGYFGDQERAGISLNAFGDLLTREQFPQGRTAIFWISPGWPMLSGPNVRLGSAQQKQIFRNIVSLSNAMRESNITLYAINPVGSDESLWNEFYYENFLKGVRRPGEVDSGDLGLQVIALQSGGRAVNSNDLGMLLNKSYADLKSYYQLSFEMPSDDGEYHSLQVKLDRPGLKAITRQGYYATP